MDRSNFSDEQFNELVSLISQGSKIGAIRLVRECTGCDLAYGKYFVEGMMAGMGVNPTADELSSYDKTVTFLNNAMSLKDNITDATSAVNRVSSEMGITKQQAMSLLVAYIDPRFLEVI